MECLLQSSVHSGMKNDPIETALAQLDDIPLHTPTGKAAFTKALAAKSNLIVAKAARLIGNAQWIELNPDMAAAFSRMIAKGAVIDKACAAMIAIARVLVQSDYDAPDLYLRGIHHVQMEASYGPAIDTAAELREVCAMGLANSIYPHKLRELVPLLVDKEWRVRAAVIRAIGVIGTDAASLLLRYKMLLGDKDPEVMSDCFMAVLTLEGAEGVPLVAPFAESGNPEVREAAILAMGASRRADAVEWLIAKFANTADKPGRKCILLSLSTSRMETAVAFLLDLVRNGSPATSTLAIDALSIHARDRQLSAQVDSAVASRNDNMPFTKLVADE
jgi:HEAT repeat protein